MNVRSRAYGSNLEPAFRMKKHQGKPKPQTGLGVPQRLRENKKRANVVDKHTQTNRERKRGQTFANKGQVLKGTSTQTKSRPQRPKYHTNKPNRHPESTEQNTIYQSNRGSEELSQQGGGAHGPPCPFGETPQGTAVPRGPKTPPPLREPPLETQKQS